MMLQLLLALLLISSAFALFESQLGEYDWLKQNIGFARSSVSHKDGLFVLSEDGILARLNAQTGETEWRAILPEGSSFEGMALGVEEGLAFGISASPCPVLNGESTGMCTMYSGHAYSIATGESLWEKFLGKTASSIVKPADVGYITNRGHVGMIAGNKAFRLVAATGEVVWNYTPDKNSRIMLSKVPTATDTSTVKADKEYAAIGCTTSGTDKDTVCIKTVLVTADISSTSVSSDASISTFYSPGTGVKAEKLAFDFTSLDASTGVFATTDSIFGPTSTGLGVVSLSTGKLSTHAFEKSAPKGDNAIFMLEAAALLPGDWGEDSARSGAAPTAIRCSATDCEAVVATKGQDKAPSHFSCASSAARMGVEYKSLSGSLNYAKSLLCVTTTTTNGDNISNISNISAATDIDIAIATDTEKKNPKKYTADLFSITPEHTAEVSALPVPVDGSDSFLRFQHKHLVFASVQTSKKNGARVNVMTSIGEFGMHTSPSTSTPSVVPLIATAQAQSMWMRMESLARTHDAKLVSRSRTLSSSSSSSSATGHRQLSTGHRQLSTGHRQQGHRQRQRQGEGEGEKSSSSSFGSFDVGLGLDAVLDLIDEIQESVIRILLGVVGIQTNPKVSASTEGGGGGRGKGKIHVINRYTSTHNSKNKVKDDLGKRFGFNKLSIVVAGGHTSGLVFMAVDVLSEEVVWAHELDGGGFKLPTEYGPEYGHQHQNQNQMGNSKGLLRVIVAEEGRAMLVCSAWDDKTTRLVEVETETGAVIRNAKLDGYETLSVIALAQDDSPQADRRTQDVQQHLMLKSTGTGASGTASVSLFPINIATAPSTQHFNSTRYVYNVDRRTGVFQSYRIIDSSDDNSKSSKAGSAVSGSCKIDQTEKMSSSTATTTTTTTTTLGPLECLNGGLGLISLSLDLEKVATAIFHPKDEKIITVTSPDAADVVGSRSLSLGDDSVLLKYLNKHSVLIVSQSVPTTSSGAQGPGGGGRVNTVLDESSTLYVTLVDTVSAKIIYRTSIEHGSAPVSPILVENNIVVFYWNSKAKRSELTSVSLFEGIVDRLGLTPFASKSSALVAQKQRDQSKFSSFLSVPPLAMQKSYVMPHAVSAAHYTTTRQGVANKNILVALTTGQVYMLDSRMISPRRPMAEPSETERMEGLMQYTPFLVLLPHSCITHNYELGGDGAKKIVSAGSMLESTSMVMSFSRPDVHFNRVLASGDFDLLASDFNYPLLTLLLGGIVVGVMWMRKAQKEKVQATLWK